MAFGSRSRSKRLGLPDYALWGTGIFEVCIGFFLFLMLFGMLFYPTDVLDRLIPHFDRLPYTINSWQQAAIAFGMHAFADMFFGMQQVALALRPGAPIPPIIRAWNHVRMFISFLTAVVLLTDLLSLTSLPVLYRGYNANRAPLSASLVLGALPPLAYIFAALLVVDGTLVRPIAHLASRWRPTPPTYTLPDPLRTIHHDAELPVPASPLHPPVSPVGDDTSDTDDLSKVSTDASSSAGADTSTDEGDGDGDGEDSESDTQGVSTTAQRRRTSSAPRRPPATKTRTSTTASSRGSKGTQSSTPSSHPSLMLFSRGKAQSGGHSSSRTVTNASRSAASTAQRTHTTARPAKGGWAVLKTLMAGVFYYESVLSGTSGMAFMLCPALLAWLYGVYEAPLSFPSAVGGGAGGGGIASALNVTAAATAPLGGVGGAGGVMPVSPQGLAGLSFFGAFVCTFGLYQSAAAIDDSPSIVAWWGALDVVWLYVFVRGIREVVDPLFNPLTFVGGNFWTHVAFHADSTLLLARVVWLLADGVQQRWLPRVVVSLLDACMPSAGRQSTVRVRKTTR